LPDRPDWLKKEVNKGLVMYDSVKYARNFAIEAHGDQKYGHKPYIYHLDHVYQVCCRFGYTNDSSIVLQIGCFLHDVAEDTPYSTDEIEDVLGGSTISEKYAACVKDLVLSVTDFPEGKKKETFTKRTRYNKTGILLKMFDRIANIEACLAENKIQILKRYNSEHPLFAEILEPWKVDQNVWNYLEELNKIVVGKMYKDIL
jgi:guanosine-3',5'-bis(diphosphate) 3'-pyrophosphohydrolase